MSFIGGIRRSLYRCARWGFRRIGYDVVIRDASVDYNDFDLRREDEQLGIFSAVTPYTMTGAACIAALCRSVEYIVEHDIPGDIVECGVWKGGSSMAAALRLKQLGDTSRQLYLYDTFEGMPAPGEWDRDHKGRPGKEWEREHATDDANWLEVPLEQVRANLSTTSYPPDKIHLIKGRVEDTIPDQVPDQIAILRLDTDFYESTRHELQHLYPRLSPGGVLIIDDYGFWQGSQRAVDEYLQQHTLPLLLHRIDHSARMCVKPGLPAGSPNTNG